jgi:hypothetical protein
MTTVKIDIPDQQASALAAKAAAAGLSLEEFFRRLTDEQAPPRDRNRAQEAARRILELQKCVKPHPEG